MKKLSRPTPLPTKQAILDFLADSPDRVGKREIGRAFGIKGGAAKIELKKLLKEMAGDGLIERKNRKQMTLKGQLPPVAVLDITGTDRDGELLARPATIEADPPPHILIVSSKRTGRTPEGVGERVLARLSKTGPNSYEARVIRRIGRGSETILGIYQKAGNSGRLVPVDKRSRHQLTVHPKNAGEAKNGDLVLAERIGEGGRRGGLRAARVREVLGARMDDPRTISLIAIHEHGIPIDFPPDALRQAETAKPAALGDRTDLRDIPLITIDPADARDHDDAIWAAPDDDPNNPGGWQVIVAIADVAHYVTPASPLDRAARERGNSTYFPDRVVPMLPEALSTGLCSLKEGEDRACMAVRMVFEANGKKRRHEFIRGLMRSAASLAYEDAQSAFDSAAPTARAEPIAGAVLTPLYEAYKCVTKARQRRAPLDLDLPEHKIRLDDAGKVKSVAVAERFDAHKLVEEFMILANVAAAETLEKKKSPLIYRVHEPPNREKLVALKDFLATLGIKFALGQVIKPELFNRILQQVKGTGHEEMVNTVVLRSQSQAVYSPENFGHFGLNLARYAHFTSPIRRYADLIVHRALISGLGLGGDGLTPVDEAGLAQTSEHISDTERRSMAAERDSVDRYIAAFMAAHVGAEFPGAIASVTRFGLFIRLSETGADGLVPISHLPDDYYVHDEKAHALTGERTGRRYTLGEPVTVRLAEAAPITGGLRFELLAGGTVDKKRRGPKQPSRRDKAKGRHKRRKT